MDFVSWDHDIPNWMDSHSKFHGSSHHQPADFQDLLILFSVICASHPKSQPAFFPHGLYGSGFHKPLAHLIFLVQLYVKLPGLVNVYKKLWKELPCLMGKLTISMVIFNSFLYVYQRLVLKLYSSSHLKTSFRDLRHQHRRNWPVMSPDRCFNPARRSLDDILDYIPRKKMDSTIYIYIW